jgi:antitoxin (DNA-binding transcriptional repressor) of toxin-antitoxin stability system
MKTVGACEAKTHLIQLLNRVCKRERILITRHRTAIAVLQPPEQGQKGDPAEVVAEILEFRDRHALHGLTLCELIEEGQSRSLGPEVTPSR